MIRIVTDGTVDMPPDWEKKYEIHVLPLRLVFGSATYTQGVDLSRDDFYRMVREKGIIPKTSLPSPQQLADFYRKLASPGDEILSMHISGKLSGTMDVVRTVVEDLRSEIKITAFDSLAGSAALGMMCREARLLARRGTSMAGIVQRMEEIRRTMAVVFTIDRLDFARMSGRVTFAQSLMASLLNIKPVVVLRDGLLEMGQKVRTRHKAMELVVDQVSDRMKSQKINLAIAHAAAPEAAHELMEKARGRLNCCLSMIVDLATPVAAHLGPGAVGICATPILEELEQ